MKEIAKMETSIAIMKAKISAFVDKSMSENAPMKNTAEMSVIAYALIEFLVDAKAFPDLSKKAKHSYWNFLIECMDECIDDAARRLK